MNHEHCLHELRLACLELALKSVAHKEDLEEVLMIADAFFDFVMEHECGG